MDIVTGKILKLRNWPDGKIIGLAKQAAGQLAETEPDREAVLMRLEAVRQNPGAFLSDPVLGELARECIRISQKDEPGTEELRKSPLPFQVWGRENVDEASLAQMENAMRLPVSVAGALMPDAHLGYGLPIGGVLAVENAVIPYAVGVDIACRMRLSLFEVSPHLLEQKKGLFEDALWRETAFGMGAEWKGSRRPNHEVLDDPAWQATPLLKSLHDNAVKQLGTSGTGNHFVEWGTFRLYEPLGNLKAGEYLALLSHSGSRSVGFKIAEHYSKLAMQIHPHLDKSIRHLAWLLLASEAGQEYWLSMELAGRFAAANHEVIHKRVAAAVGLKETVSVENHHNFCLPADVIIPTIHGPKRMADICPGDTIYAFDAEQGIKETTVLRHWSSGKKRTKILRTWNREIKASGDHPILTIEIDSSDTPNIKGRKGKIAKLTWKPLSDIRVGNIIVCAEGYYQTSESIGEPKARLIGALLGDGWIRHNTTNGRYTVGLAIGNQKEKHTRKYLSLLQEELPPANWTIDQPGMFGLTCSSAKVWRAIEKMGLTKYSKEKQVPPIIFNLPVNEKLAFLAGYVDADGSIASDPKNHGRATIATTNRILAEEIREIAIGCRLRITPLRVERTKSNFGDTTSYRCVLSADSANQLDVWHDTKSQKRRATIFAKPQGLKQKQIGNIRLPPNAFAQRVIKIEDSAKEEEVFDLTVEHPSHSFIANGVVVHNCWKEKLPDGLEVFVHRKGATPAGSGVLGIIPGSMGDAGYLVRGKGNPDSLQSASHGAGRLMSRKAAINTISKSARDAYLAERGVTLLGGGLDESPQAYKPIEEIIAAQADLVEVLGRFQPRIVRMANEPGDV